MVSLWQVWSLYDSVAGLADRWPESTALMDIRQDQWDEAGKKVRVRWTPVPFSKISENMKRAVLAGEDGKFYQHHGFDVEAIQKAVEYNRKTGNNSRGASTITQQLAKNLYLSPHRSFVRKGKEALYTMALEHFLTKDRILELYLNVIEWGEGIYGIEAASQTYYGVSAAHLSLDQAASLAAVLPKPLKVKPTGNSRFVAFRKSAILRNLSRYQGIHESIDGPLEFDPEDQDPGDGGPDQGAPDIPVAAPVEPQGRPETPSVREKAPIQPDSVKSIAADTSVP